MLVRFAIDPEAMPMADTPPGPRRRIHERLIEKWITQGLLVFAGSRRDESTIVERINSLPQDLRTIWQKALRVGRTLPGPPGWPGLEHLEQLEDLRPIKGKIQLACLETVRYCHALNLEETATCRSLANPVIEVARFDCADAAESFQAAAELGRSGIDLGEPIARFWSRRFAPIAAVSDLVTIVDRYCLQDGESINGLDRFITELNRTARRCSLAIYAACGIPRPADGFIESANDLVTKVQGIAQRIATSGVRSIHITLVPKRHFRRDSHGRYIRFDSSAIEIDLGAGLFYGDAVGNTWRRCQFTFKREDSFHKNAESDLRAHREQGSPWRVR